MTSKEILQVTIEIFTILFIFIHLNLNGVLDLKTLRLKHMKLKISRFYLVRYNI